MPRFSDRVGATQPRRQLQIDGMDQELRNALWNWLCRMFSTGRTRADPSGEEYWRNAALGGLWDEVFHLAEDSIPDYAYLQNDIKKRFMTAPWFEVYNIIEFVLPNIVKFRGGFPHGEGYATNTLNHILEREMSGYRAINHQLVPITSPAEIAAITEAATVETGFKGVADHIDTALRMLGKKPDPDYRNSIKESISAVEAIVKLMTGETSGGIDKAVAILERRGVLHPSLKVALIKLYSYTSDDDGIRHAILEKANVNAADAKFMLVTCSALVNYLIDASRAPSTA